MLPNETSMIDLWMRTPAGRAVVIDLVNAIRSEALDELGRLARHELSTIHHVTSHALASCEAGDLAAAVRRLASAVDRSRHALDLLEGYRERPVGNACTTKLSAVRDVVLSSVMRRVGGIPCVLVLGDLLDEDIAVAPSALTLVLVEVIAALSANCEAHPGGVRVEFEREPSDKDHLRFGISTASTSGATANRPWRVEWAAAKLAADGGLLLGPEERYVARRGNRVTYVLQVERWPGGGEP